MDKGGGGRGSLDAVLEIVVIMVVVVAINFMML